jgi:hypothetical protein
VTLIGPARQGGDHIRVILYPETRINNEPDGMVQMHPNIKFEHVRSDSLTPAGEVTYGLTEEGKVRRKERSGQEILVHDRATFAAALEAGVFDPVTHTFDLSRMQDYIGNIADNLHLENDMGLFTYAGPQEVNSIAGYLQHCHPAAAPGP